MNKIGTQQQETLTSESARLAKAFRPHEFKKDIISKQSGQESIVAQNLSEKKLPIAQRSKKGNIYMIDFMKSTDSQPTLENFINSGKRV